jgi:hypothetical protein
MSHFGWNGFQKPTSYVTLNGAKGLLDAVEGILRFAHTAPVSFQENDKSNATLSDYSE